MTVRKDRSRNKQLLSMDYVKRPRSSFLCPAKTKTKFEGKRKNVCVSERENERESVCLCVCLCHVFVVGRTKRDVEVERRQPSNLSTYAFPKQDLFQNSAINNQHLMKNKHLITKKARKTTSIF